MSFTSETKDFTLEFIGGSQDTMRGTTAKLWGVVIKASPVGEVGGGRFRGNWFPGRDPSTEVTNKKDTDGGATVARANNSVFNQ